MQTGGLNGRASRREAVRAENSEKMVLAQIDQYAKKCVDDFVELVDSAPLEGAVHYEKMIQLNQKFKDWLRQHAGRYYLDHCRHFEKRLRVLGAGENFVRMVNAINSLERKSYDTIMSEKKVVELGVPVTARPLRDKILVRRDHAETETAGGIIIPGTVKVAQSKGLVVAVGPGTKEEPMGLKVGDRILFGQYAGEGVEVEGEELVMLREGDVIAIL